MALNSLKFLAYFTVLCIMLSFLQLAKFFVKKIIKKDLGAHILDRLQIVLILLFSYAFICAADLKFGICIALLTLFTYFIGILLGRTEGKIKRLCLTIGICLSLLMLVFFKYSNFFADSFMHLLGKGNVNLKIMLPVGISFYTLSAVGYLIDVYRGDYKPEKNLLNYGLFMACFTKITAGPIIRAGELLPQIKKYRGINWSNISIGIQIFVFGLFKKIVLADRLGVFVNDVFNAPAEFNTFSVIWAVISYSLQIYLDFSGYSDMAIGMSKILGFDFSRNFNLPYISANLSEFWKRWHISLSSWFKDYLYIPLGGSRNGKYRTILNLIIVMLCSGLWHGAAWTFVIWGLMYGIFEAIYSLFKRKKNIKVSRIQNICSIAVNYVIVALLWVVFRADSLSKSIDVYKLIFTYHKGIMQPYTWTFFAIACVAASTFAAIIKSKRDHDKYVNGFYPILDLTKLSSLIIFFTFTGLTIIMAYFGNNAFIYGKF